MLRFDPAQAYWDQRHAVARSRQRLCDLSRAVGCPSDLPLYQFVQLFAVALDFRPDLILELGRGRGNSTCAFCEAANQIGGESRVVSLCESKLWHAGVSGRVAKIVPESWFNRLSAERGEILDFDPVPILGGRKRVLLFWDAHGFDVADYVLGLLLPRLAAVEHLVIMHDISDNRYQSEESFEYGGNPLWRGGGWAGPLVPGMRLKLGNIESAVEQSVAILDFTTRNKLALDSADRSLHQRFDRTPEGEEMGGLLGDIFETQANWTWFSLNERSGGYTFPKFVRRPTRAAALWKPLTGEQALLDLDYRSTSLLDLRRRRRRCAGAQVYGRNPTYVVTPPELWERALLLPFRETALCALPEKAWIRIRLDGVVESGEIGLGVVLEDGETYVLPEVTKTAAEDEMLYETVLEKPPAHCSLAIRNHARAGNPSILRIRSIETSFRKA